MTEPGRLAQVEKSTGPLSQLQRVMLGTDGSVTQLLELATGSPVAITTLVQEIREADPGIAGTLEIPPGEKVNYRVVELRNCDTGELLMHAVSRTPLARLSPSFREDLLSADIPIGRILQKHRIESRREILDIGCWCPDSSLPSKFGIPQDSQFLSRNYRIIHKGRPLIAIEETFPRTMFSGRRRVSIVTPSRLHLSLIDLNGTIGRVDGGIGLALKDPGISLSAEMADVARVQGCDQECRERILSVLIQVEQALDLPGNAEITMHHSYPRHIGLGLGTQTALAVGRALCALYGRDISASALARITGRGGTSGIGTAAFEHGGFLIDGGHSFGKPGDKNGFLPSSAAKGIMPASLTVRHPFPEDWKILVVIPDAVEGASGIPEKGVFTRYCPVPLDEVREICHVVLMMMLPGIVEKDLDLFGRAVNRLGQIGFKKVETGLLPPVISSLPAILRDAGAAGSGISSFGPAVYAFTDSDEQSLECAARDHLENTGGGTFIHTRARNEGATVFLA